LCLVAVAAAGAAALAWQLTQGSLTLDPLRRQIETALVARLPPGATVSIGSANLSWRRATGVRVLARDIELALPNAFAITATEFSTATTAAALLRGEVNLDSVAAAGVAVTAVLARGPELTGTTSDLVRSNASLVVDQMSAAANLIRAAGLENIEVHDATLRLVGPDGDTIRDLAVAEASWQPLGERRSKAWLRFGDREELGWDLTLERRSLDDGTTSLAFEIEDLPVAALAPTLARTEGRPFVDAAVTVQARVASRDGELIGIRGRLSSGPGEVSFTGNDRIFMVGTSLGFALGETGARMAISRGEIATRSGTVLFEGSADLNDVGGVILVGRIVGGALPSFEADGARVALVGGGVMAHVDFSDLALEVQRLTLVTRDGSASAIGQASLAGPAPGLSFALSLSEMPAEVVRAFWPPFVASKTRRWFDMNVRSGRLGPATLRVALPPDYIGRRRQGRPLPSYALAGALPFRDAQFSPLSTFPVIGGAAGEIVFADGKATFKARSGSIAVAGYGAMDAAGTTLVIPELGRTRPWGDLHLELDGPAAALAMLSDTPPLSVAKTHGIVADALSGDASLSLDASIPLFGDAEEDIHPTFRLALSAFSSETPIEGRIIQDSELILEGSPESFTVKGEGSLDGMNASVDLILGTAAADRMDVVVELDDEARERLGLSLGGLVTGPVYTSLTNDGDSQLVALDLKDARIAVPALGWEKGKGVPATAHFRMRETADGKEITELLVSGKGFGAKGSLRIGADGRIVEAELAELSLRADDRLSLTATAEGDGYDVQVRGESLDARGIIAAVRKQDEGETDLDIYPIRISLALDEVLGETETLLEAVAGSLTISADGLEAAELTGRIGSSDAFEWTLGKEGGERHLRLFADDAGELFRFAGLYSKIAGGNLILDYTGEVGGAGAGMAMLRNFRLINEAALQPTMASARRREDPMAFAPVGSTADDLTFTELRVPFRQQDWVMSITDATLRGPMIGATGEGTVNVAGGKVALSGTFIPAFGINNIAGAIPILGPILGGGRDEGLVGITYKMFGPLEAPTLTLNPVSVLAPGIFRKIFE
jgi:hypothetical protein